MDHKLISKRLVGARWLLVCWILLIAFGWWKLYQRLPAMPMTLEQAAVVPPPTWPAIQPIDESSWSVFRREASTRLVLEQPIEQRFRLNGTFFHYDVKKRTRKAILSDLQNNRQFEVIEGDQVEAFSVRNINHDHVVLEKDGERFELWLSYARTQAPGQTDTNRIEQATEPEPLEVSAYGKRIDEVRYILDRQALEAYYQEVREDPERLANIYLSMKPVYEKEEVEGYLLDMAGEEEFFKAFGVQNGDIIRRVNSIRMVSQRRAEYLLGEFIKNELNIFDFDIERNGERKQIIHLIR